jgi:two-component system nitrogen regulation response regulator GlnG
MTLQPRPAERMALVLIVEDDEALLQVLAETVERFGYMASLAGTAAEAVRVMKNCRADAIVLDMALPDSGGTATLNRLQKVRPNVPIIMLTANTDEALARATLQQGAFDYIVKPFEAERLGRVLEAAVAVGARSSRKQ